MAWKRVYDATGWYLEVEYTLTADPINNRTKLTCKQIRVGSKSSAYSLNYSSGSCQGGVATITAQRKTQNLGAVNIKNSSQTFNVTDDSRYISHNSSGKFTGELNVHGYFKSPFGNSYGCPNGWYLSEIDVPDIDRSGGTTTATFKEKTYNSITLTLKSSVSTKKARYRVNGAEWIEYTPPSSVSVTGGGSYDKTFYSLLPNTSYKIDVQHFRTYNEVWSSTGTVTATTDKPDQGNAQTITITETHTYNTINYTFSGGTPGSGASVSYYRINFEGEGWTNLSPGVKTFSKAGLKPNTAYLIRVDFVDDYGTVASGSASLTVTTDKPPAPTIESVGLDGRGYNSLTFGFNVKFGDGATWGYLEYQLDDGDWVNNGASATVSISELEANSTHTIKGHVYDNYDSVSNTVSGSGTTLRPDEPEAGTIGYTYDEESKTYTFKAENFKASEGATLSKYQWKFSTDEVWQDGTDTYQWTWEKGNTEYTIMCRAVDNVGNVSDAASLKFTTPLAGVLVYVKKDGELKKGLLNIYDGTDIRLAVKVSRKEDI